MSEQTELNNPQDNKILKSLNPRNVIIPIVIGLGITAYLLYRDITANGEQILAAIQNVNYLWLMMAIVALLFRDGFYIYRIRHLSKKALTWVGSFYTIILWEFSSAISPSAVGGTAVASFILMKEGISFGKSLAYVMVSAILDNLFFLILGAVVLTLNVLEVYPNGIFHLEVVEGVPDGTSEVLRYTFYTSYTVILLYNSLMMYGLFFQPAAIKWLFIKITSIGFLKRFQKGAAHQGDELVIASAQLKGIGAGYWIKGIVSTILVWTSRYFIVNCLIAAFFGLAFADHAIIFSRHVILWVVLIIAITPGAAGIAEYAFKGFFTPYALTLTGIIAILWRMITFYPYLIAGVIFLPRWVKRVFFDHVSRVQTEKIKAE